MRIQRWIYGTALLALCGMFTYGGSTEAFAFYQTTELGGPGLSSGAYAVTVDAERVTLNVAHDSNEVLMTALQGES
ncbi:MAG: hypothetical protein RR590_11325, partial [Hungatella sp.]